jgi:hypothetical protein
VSKKTYISVVKDLAFRRVSRPSLHISMSLCIRTCSRLCVCVCACTYTRARARVRVRDRVRVRPVFLYAHTRVPTHAQRIGGDDARAALAKHVSISIRMCSLSI